MLFSLKRELHDAPARGLADIVERLSFATAMAKKFVAEYAEIPDGVSIDMALMMARLRQSKCPVKVGGLTSHGFYLGTNVSYNKQKMVERGYLEETTTEDRRSKQVSLSPKGIDVADRVINVLAYVEEHIDGAFSEDSYEKIRDFIGSSGHPDLFADEA